MEAEKLELFICEENGTFIDEEIVEPRCKKQFSGRRKEMVKTRNNLHMLL